MQVGLKQNKQQLGNNAEKRACDFLLQQKLQLLDRNYRSAWGEIDLIMQDQADIVFIEVRMRNHIQYGSAIESVDERKQKKLLKTAISYLQCRNWYNKVDCRFDIVGIFDNHIDWIKNAFSYGPYFRTY